ncbi:MAG: hypothetical protein ABIR56_01360 [Polaromonas sp.]
MHTPTTAMQWTRFRWSPQLARTLPRTHQRVFPSQRVTLRPDEKAQRWLLSVSASDQVGLLYCVARVLARHKINLQLAKSATLGERVEDTFLIDGPDLQHNKGADRD